MTFLIFGGTLAAGALFSIAAVAAFVAFTIPIFIRVFFVGDRFRPGPWNLGRYSMYIGSAACAFVLLMVPILMLPSLTGSDLGLVISNANDLCDELILSSADTMNWTCLVYGGPMLFVVIYWFVDAHKWFKGPKVLPTTTEMLLDQPLMSIRRSTSSTRCSAEKATWWKGKRTTAETRVQAVSQGRTGNFKTRRRQILLERWGFWLSI